MIHIYITLVLVILLNVFALCISSEHNEDKKYYRIYDAIFAYNKEGYDAHFRFVYHYSKTQVYINTDLKIQMCRDSSNFNQRTYLIYINDVYLGTVKQSDKMYIIDDDFNVFEDTSKHMFYASSSIDNKLFKEVTKQAYRSFRRSIKNAKAN